MVWDPTPRGWQHDLIDKLNKRSIDVAQLERDLKLTPTERLEKVVAMARFADDLRKAMRDRLQKAP